MTDQHSPSHETRLIRAQTALDGLSVGDAFGQLFFDPSVWMHYLPTRSTPETPWRWTDDTEMAISIMSVLRDHKHIDRDVLAARFAERYDADSHRGYGAGAHDLLRAILSGESWQDASRNLFRGTGSFGNGGAMRVAPIGAYFADDYESVVEQADRSAEVTHAHPEGRAGAIAIAVATAWACRRQAGMIDAPPRDLILTAIRHTPESAVRDGLHRAMKVSLDETSLNAAEELGDGSRIIAQDTVPFCVWAAAANIDDFKTAMWATISVGGDIDTNAAIVGGIIASSVGPNGIPTDWLRRRGSLC
ncbi:MAG: ADP-ribosylglycohydrolase family protein [Phycisphaera sp.]|nr:ADP-ribosylglycohydrolase family protein [Phycisphaera sp.]